MYFWLLFLFSGHFCCFKIFFSGNKIPDHPFCCFILQKSLLFGFRFFSGDIFCRGASSLFPCYHHITIAALCLGQMLLEWHYFLCVGGHTQERFCSPRCSSVLLRVLARRLVSSAEVRHGWWEQLSFCSSPCSSSQCLGILGATWALPGADGQFQAQRMCCGRILHYYCKSFQAKSMANENCPFWRRCFGHS